MVLKLEPPRHRSRGDVRLENHTVLIHFSQSVSGNVERDTASPNALSNAAARGKAKTQKAKTQFLTRDGFVQWKVATDTRRVSADDKTRFGKGREESTCLSTPSLQHRWN